MLDISGKARHLFTNITWATVWDVTLLPPCRGWAVLIAAQSTFVITQRLSRVQKGILWCWWWWFQCWHISHGYAFYLIHWFLYSLLAFPWATPKGSPVAVVPPPSSRSAQTACFTSSNCPFLGPLVCERLSKTSLWSQSSSAWWRMRRSPW